MLLGLLVGMIVAGTAPGPTVAAQDVGGKLAVTLAAPGAESVTETSVAPLWPDEAVIAKTTAGGEVFVGGAVNPAAASVEITFEGDQVIRVPTVGDDAYAGRARFFVGQVASRDIDDDPTTIRVLDAGGATIGVPKSPDVERSAVLRGRPRVKATVTSRLDAVALAPEHRTDTLCLSAGGAEVCRNRPEVISLGGEIGCDRVPSTLMGFVPDGTRSLDLVLGSGRTIRVMPHAAPLGQPGLVVTTVLPRGEAIRTATARGVGRVAVRVAPPARRCGGRRAPWIAFGDEPASRPGRPPGTQLAAELAANGGSQLLVRDDGEKLCAGIDRLDLRGGDCSLPPLSARNAVLSVHDGYAVGVYPAQVAEVEVRFRGGETLRAPALPGARYTGRYRDAVHFVLIPLLAGRTVTGATLHDAGGRALGAALAFGPDAQLDHRPRTLLRDGSVRLVGGTYVDGRGRYPCIGIGAECSEELATNTVIARATCSPRRTIVFGVVHRRVARVDVDLAGGRRVRAQLAAGPTGTVYLAVLGPREAVTGVRVADRRVTSFRLPGARPSRQCGWDAY